MTVDTEAPPVREPATTTLLLRQLQGIDDWTSARRLHQQELAGAGPSREGRLDGARRLEAWDRAHHALITRLDDALTGADFPLVSKPGLRAIVVHRQQWFVQKLTEALRELHVAVVAVCDNGADAVGTLVGEQPDLLLVEESLPLMPGQQVVAEAVRYAPATMVVAQVSHGDRIGDFLDAGARAAVTRQIPPADVAQQMHALLGASA